MSHPRYKGHPDLPSRQSRNTPTAPCIAVCHMTLRLGTRQECGHILTRRWFVKFHLMCFLFGLCLKHDWLAPGTSDFVFFNADAVHHNSVCHRDVAVPGAALIYLWLVLWELLRIPLDEGIQYIGQRPPYILAVMKGFSTLDNGHHIY